MKSDFKSKFLVGLFLILMISVNITFLQKLHYSELYNNPSKDGNPKLNAPDITIITPENITYTETMNGYYLASQGFENDVSGENPSGMITQESYNEVNIQVIDYIDGHQKIVEVNDQNITEGYVGIILTSGFPKSYGTIEYWLRFNSITDGLFISGRDPENVLCISFVIEGGRWKYIVDMIRYDIPNVPVPQVNTWYHFKVAFRCQNAPPYNGMSQNSYIVSIDGINSGELPFRDPGENIDYYRLLSDPTNNVTFWVDAVGYSWDQNYNIGDNLNEGLLLGFENSTSLDWMGYSLDGQTNKTIYGNTTISFPEDGLHTIQVFGNDSMGDIHESDVRYFTIDTIPPEISITYPTTGQEFSDPPSFILSITEENLVASWYTLNGGSNIPFTGDSGVIDSTAWNSLPDGPVTISFYIRDSAYREDFEEVTVVKVPGQEPEPSPKIPGYNIFLILGLTGITIIGLINKRIKN